METMHYVIIFFLNKMFSKHITFYAYIKIKPYFIGDDKQQKNPGWTWAKFYNYNESNLSPWATRAAQFWETLGNNCTENMQNTYNYSIFYIGHIPLTHQFTFIIYSIWMLNFIYSLEVLKVSFSHAEVKTCNAIQSQSKGLNRLIFGKTEGWLLNAQFLKGY